MNILSANVRGPGGDEIDPEAKGDETKPFRGPVTIEQGFQVDGRKLTVLVQFPAPVAEQIGMENLVAAANRALVTIESKNHEVAKVRGRR